MWGFTKARRGKKRQHSAELWKVQDLFSRSRSLELDSYLGLKPGFLYLYCFGLIPFHLCCEHGQSDGQNVGWGRGEGSWAGCSLQ